MRHTAHSTCAIVAFAAGSALLTPSLARADIVGFDGLTGWTPKVGPADTAPPINTPHADTVVLTTGGGNLRAIWSQTPQSITGFAARFTYHASNSTGSSGLTFILHNDPRGQDALGSFNNSNGFAGITNSVGVGFNFSFSDTETRVGVGRNGSISASEPMTPVTAVTREIDVELIYDGSSLLKLTAVDVIDPSLIFTRNYILPESIMTTIGGSTAIVGFGAGTNNGPPGIAQTISDFSFVVPTPATLPALGMLGFAAMRRRR